MSAITPFKVTNVGINQKTVVAQSLWYKNVGTSFFCFFSQFMLLSDRQTDGHFAHDRLCCIYSMQ